VEALAADSDDAAGWSALLDPDTCPPAGLPFLGQMVGVQVPPGATAVTARALVKAHGGWGTGHARRHHRRRPTHVDRREARHLTERDGSPYRVKVTTYTAETPDTAALEAAVNAALPAGLVATFDLLTGWTVAEMETEESARTIAYLEAHWATVADFEAQIP
jgi:hypothetical protein